MAARASVLAQRSAGFKGLLWGCFAAVALVAVTTAHARANDQWRAGLASGWPLGLGLGLQNGERSMEMELLATINQLENIGNKD